MDKGLPIKTIRVKNFKAIVDTGNIKLGSFTALIGNNGSGKSSLIEALEFLRDLVVGGVDVAFSGRLGGPEHIWNKKSLIGDGRSLDNKPKRMNRDPKFSSAVIQFEVTGEGLRQKLKYAFKVAHDNEAMDTVAIYDERIKDLTPGSQDTVSPAGEVGNTFKAIGKSFALDCADWVFLDLHPEFIGLPTKTVRSQGNIRIKRDGSNIADYLMSFRSHPYGVDAIENVVEAMKFIVNYVEDIVPDVARTTIEKTSYVKMTEQGHEIPSWLFSSGTLRALVILSVLNDPNRPPLIVIEEIENGLDPNTLRFIVGELKRIANTRKQQVIVTTHSPFLLDMLELSDIIVVERQEGAPKFTRFDRDEALTRWTSSFSLGDVYTMGKLNARGKKA